MFSKQELLAMGLAGAIAALLAGPFFAFEALAAVTFGSTAAGFVFAKYVLGGDPKLLNDPAEYVKVTLMEKEEVTHDVRRFRFKLPSDKHVLGLPVGKHIYLRAEIDGKVVARQYTPVTMIDDKGFFDLCLKIYFKNVHPRFPDGGPLSQYLNDMEIGAEIECRGPTGSHTYRGNGIITKENTKTGEVKETRTAKHLGMIAGGTGITPMLQIIRHVLRDPLEKTQMKLLFANQSEDDILLREELEQCAKDDRFDFWYTVDRAPTEGWKYSTGFIDQSMLEEHLPPVGPDTQIVMCGPPPMVKFACLPNLEKAGFTEANWIVF
jgi:cytochrome-b5 reductase